MKIRVAHYRQKWILQKFAKRLYESLRRLNQDVTLDEGPDPSADINHHIMYLNYDGRRYSVDTVMLTHFVSPWEMELARVQLRNAAMGVCMSSDVQLNLVRSGFPEHQLGVAIPGHDGVLRPRPLLLGITTRLYDDGRKREDMLLEVSRQLNPHDFRFHIMGIGWKLIVAQLKQLGFQVQYDERFDYGRYCHLIPTLDYFLYPGRDEGSMGFLDALAAGVPTIVTPQGFHLDVPNGITHSFETGEDLLNILKTIVQERDRRCQSVAKFTWDNYAQQHLNLWEKLLQQPQTSPEDPDVPARVQQILGTRFPETFGQRCHRLFVREGFFRAGGRVISRWLKRT